MSCGANAGLLEIAAADDGLDVQAGLDDRIGEPFVTTGPGRPDMGRAIGGSSIDGGGRPC